MFKFWNLLYILKADRISIVYFKHMRILARHVICKPFMVLSIPPVIYGMNSTRYNSTFCVHLLDPHWNMRCIVGKYEKGLVKLSLPISSENVNHNSVTVSACVSSQQCCSVHYLYEVFVVPHSSPEVPAQFPILCIHVFNGVKLVFRLSLSLPRKIVMITFVHCKGVVRIKVG